MNPHAKEDGSPIRETADQGDPTSWEFYVLAERDVPQQESIRRKGGSGPDLPARHQGSGGDG